MWQFSLDNKSSMGTSRCDMGVGFSLDNKSSMGTSRRDMGVVVLFGQ